MPLAGIPLAWNSFDSSTFPSFSTRAVTSSTRRISSSEKPITVMALLGRKQKSELSCGASPMPPFSKPEPGLRGGLRAKAYPTLGTHLHSLEVGGVVHAIHSGHFPVQIGIATGIPLKLQGLWEGQCAGRELGYSLSRALQPCPRLVHSLIQRTFVLVSSLASFVLESFIPIID